MEFTDVVACGDQVPLTAGVVQPAKQDVFALQGRDLAEDWFDDGLAPGVVGPACLGAELAGHPLLGGQVLRDPSARRRLDDLVVTEPTRSDQELRAVQCGELRCVFEVRL